MPTDSIPPEWLAQAREICLALPQATEKETWDHPTFRVKDKIFAGIGSGDGANDFRPDDGSPDPVVTMTMKSTLEIQEMLLSHGHPFFKPKYVGPSGWIGIVIDEETDWAEVEEFVIDSYCAVAPKKLAKELMNSFPEG